MDPSCRMYGKLGPLADFEWKGPEFGPYHVLTFDDVPENLIPTSPASRLAALARLANNLLRKQGRQAWRQKDIYTYTPAGAESAKKAQRTNDGGSMYRIFAAAYTKIKVVFSWIDNPERNRGLYEILGDHARVGLGM